MGNVAENGENLQACVECAEPIGHRASCSRLDTSGALMPFDVGIAMVDGAYRGMKKLYEDERAARLRAEAMTWVGASVHAEIARLRDRAYSLQRELADVRASRIVADHGAVEAIRTLTDERNTARRERDACALRALRADDLARMVDELTRELRHAGGAL